MNIFEDLIDELKEENLLEQTVIETRRTANRPDAQPKAAAEEAAEKTAAPIVEKAEIEAKDESSSETIVEIEADEPAVDESNFYRQRAMNEVAFLQTVEQVFAGVEREQLKIVPQPYDDLEVKKVLHGFLQLAPDEEEARAKAEFQLLRETENWHSSLSLRDERITTAHLRRFCETSRPPLSSPALVALARFYRNSPYSEPVRNKFDLIVTRLFSKESDSLREMIFEPDELAAHLAELYAEWSSVPLYAEDADDAEIRKIISRFEAFMREAYEAENFDQLIKNDFFTRLHSFKRGTNENFYAPAVAAVGIESNIRIGNRYLALLELEKARGNAASLEDRYGLAHDDAVSEATGKTLSLLELLKQKKSHAPAAEAQPMKAEPARETIQQKSPSAPPKAGGGFNKWIIAALVAVGLLIAAVYFITRPAQPPTNKLGANAQKLNLENSLLKEFLQTAHLENNTLNAVGSDAWANLTDEKQKEMLKLMLALGKEKNFAKVEIKNPAGKTVASADAENVFVFR